MGEIAIFGIAVLAKPAVLVLGCATCSARFVPALRAIRLISTWWRRRREEQQASKQATKHKPKSDTRIGGKKREEDIAQERKGNSLQSPQKRRP